MGPAQLRQRPPQAMPGWSATNVLQGDVCLGPQNPPSPGLRQTVAQTGSLQGDKVGAGVSRHLHPLSRSLCSHVCKHLKLLGVLSEER